MQWWQIVSIIGASWRRNCKMFQRIPVLIIGAASFAIFAWWWMSLMDKSVLPEERKQDKEAKKPATDSKAANQLFARKVQEIIASRPSAAEIPERIEAAAEAARVSIIKESSAEADPLFSSGNEGNENRESIDLREPFLLNTDFREYRVKGCLGFGGFARVQLVEDPRWDPVSKAAWKAVDKAYSEKTSMENSVVMEKQVMGITTLCPSPFIVSYYGCCHTPRYVYFKMEALMGGELYSTYQQHKFYGDKVKAQYYMACAMTAIHHLHQLRVMLRSLKPEDCALTMRGTLKLVDFGMSKLLVEKTYTTCGTPDYFCPEIIGAIGHSFEVDWWCCGIMLFELLAGNPPFESSTPMQIYSKVMAGINKVKFPGAVKSNAKDLVCSLCHSSPDRRLPVQKGFEALKSHSFFQGFDWAGLSSMSPPFVPSDGDNFSTVRVEDMPDCFSKSNATAIRGAEYWTTHFGPPGEQDDFPAS